MKRNPELSLRKPCRTCINTNSDKQFKFKAEKMKRFYDLLEDIYVPVHRD